MPYSEQQLPWTGATALSRHCSADGARAALRRSAGQTARYLRLLERRGAEGCTDLEAALILGIERTSVNARRSVLCQLDPPWVVPVGTRPGPTGIRTTAWGLSDEGRAAVDAGAQA